MESKTFEDLSKLSERQLAVLPHLLASPSIEEASRRAEVSSKQIYEWMKNPAFCKELTNQRNAIFSESLAFLKTGVQKAVQTLVSLLENEDPRICLQAADRIISNAFKGMELIEIDERISTIEKLQQKYQQRTP